MKTRNKEVRAVQLTPLWLNHAVLFFGALDWNQKSKEINSGVPPKSNITTSLIIVWGHCRATARFLLIPPPMISLGSSPKGVRSSGVSPQRSVCDCCALSCRQKRLTHLPVHFRNTATGYALRFERTAGQSPLLAPQFWAKCQGSAGDWRNEDSRRGPEIWGKGRAGRPSVA